MEQRIGHLQLLSAKLIAEIEKSSYDNVRNIYQKERNLDSGGSKDIRKDVDTSVEVNESVSEVCMKSKSPSPVHLSHDDEINNGGEYDDDTLDSNDMELINDDNVYKHHLEEKPSPRSDADYPSTNDSDYQIWNNSRSPTPDVETVETAAMEPYDSLDTDISTLKSDTGDVIHYHKEPNSVSNQLREEPESVKFERLFIESQNPVPTPANTAGTAQGSSRGNNSRGSSRNGNVCTEEDLLSKDMHEILSERLVITTPENQIDIPSENGIGLNEEMSETDEQQSARTNADQNEVTMKQKGQKYRKKTDIIARNKKGIGHIKFSGSYAKLHSLKSKSDVEEKSQYGKSPRVPGSDTDLYSETDSPSLSQSWHAQPLPPIGETNMNNAVQSAPADLYKLSCLIQEERRKLQDVGVPAPHPNFSHNQNIPPRYGFKNDTFNATSNVLNYIYQSSAHHNPPHVNPSYQGYETLVNPIHFGILHPSNHFSYPERHYFPVHQTNMPHAYRMPGPGRYFSNSWQYVDAGNTDIQPLEKEPQFPEDHYQKYKQKKLDVRGQRDYADIPRRHPKKPLASLERRKVNTVSAEDRRESKRSIALNYSKNVPRPARGLKKNTKMPDNVNRRLEDSDNPLEIMKKRHEQEKLEVERLRKQLSNNLRNGR